MEVLKTHKTKNVFIQIFKIPIYDSKVCFIRFNNRKGYDEALAFCEKIGIVTDEFNTDEWMFAYGFTCKEKTKYGFIHIVFINAAKEYAKEYTNTLAHEHYHLIQHISIHHGLTQEDGEANEHIAYLTGYLFDYLSKL